MEISTLEHTPLHAITDVLNHSFSDYIVPLKLTEEQLRFKTATEDIRTDLSYGVFSSGRLVGFMLHGLRESTSGLTAYNAATGVIPEFRGKGLTSEMYAQLQPKLRALDVKHMVLEVIATNASAIKAYEKEGYRKHRTLDCYAGTVEPPHERKEILVQDLSLSDWQRLDVQQTVRPSWQNESQTIIKIGERCRILGAFIDGKPVGYIVYQPASGKIHQLAVIPEYRRKGAATQLFRAVCENGARELHLYNADRNAHGVKPFLEHMGLVCDLTQIEMRKAL